MEARMLSVCWLWLVIMAVSVQGFIFPVIVKRNGGASNEDCGQLQTRGLRLYDVLKSTFGTLSFGPHDVLFGVHVDNRQEIAELLCRITGVSTVDGLVDAINPDMPYRDADTLGVFHSLGSVWVKYAGGVDSFRTRLRFLQDWADFILGFPDNGDISYEAALEFTTSLVGEYGNDYLLRFTRGTSPAVGYGIDSHNTDIMDAEKLARALADYDYETFDHQSFAETSGLSTAISGGICNMLEMARIPPIQFMYSQYQNIADLAVDFLKAAEDAGLLDLDVSPQY